MKLSTLALALMASITLISTQAKATEGVFDFADRCIAARSDFATQRDNVLSAYDHSLATTDTATATDDYRSLWMGEVKKRMRAPFDEDVKPVFAQMGVTDFDKAYDVWFDLQIKKFTPQQLLDAQNASYRLSLNQYLTEQKQKAEGTIDQAKDKLDGACKMDVGSQALRVALTATMEPFNLAIGNFKAAAHDGVVAQVGAALTGVNFGAILRTGNLDTSDASVFHQGTVAVQDVGHGIEHLGQEIGKIDLPNISLPNVSLPSISF